MTKFVMNIEKIINNNKINKDYPNVKEMEDTLTDIYNKNDDDILEDLSFLLEVPETNNYKITFFKDKFNLDNFKLESVILNNFNNIILTGSYIRSVLVNNLHFKNELFITSLVEINWKEILPSNYEESSDMFFKKVNDYYVYINKKYYNTPAHVLLNNKYLTRFGLYKDVFIASPMFILDYNLNIDYINKNNDRDNLFTDPIFKTPLDLFELTTNINKKNDDIFDIIDKKNYEELTNLTSFELNKLRNKLTCIEYAIELYINEECLIISQQLRLIILELFKHVTFKRHPAFYASLLNLNNKDNELFIILSQPEYIELSKYINNFNSIDSLNSSYLEYYIKTDKSNEFYSFIKYISGKIDNDIINNLIKYNPEEIIIRGICKSYLSDYNIYKIILLSQQLNYTKHLKFNVDIAINFIDKILDQCLIKSFFYIYKISPSVINTLDTNNNTVLHLVNEKSTIDNYTDMVKLIISLDQNIIFKKNKNGENALLYHIKNKNFNIVNIILDLIKNKKISDILQETDKDGNNILHLLCISDKNITIIRNIIFDNLYLLETQNKLLQTPIIIATMYSCEDIFFLLKSINAELDTTDIYGNTVYHYICLNGICVGMGVYNKHNIFGYRPEDYCRISKKYYCFIT